MSSYTEFQLQMMFLPLLDIDPTPPNIKICPIQNTLRCRKERYPCTPVPRICHWETNYKIT